MPPIVTLVLEIDPVALEELTRLDMRIVLAKSAGGAVPNAVWLAWAPSAVSTVVWGHNYGIFAATTPERAGAPIQPIAAVLSAIEGATYSFSGKRFDGPVPNAAVLRGHYELRNDAEFAASFGLLQAAAIDGVPVTAPVNAVALPACFIADFGPFDTVHVWAEADASGATTVSGVPVSATTIAFAPGKTTMRCRYDRKTARFVGSDA